MTEIVTFQLSNHVYQNLKNIENHNAWVIVEIAYSVLNDRRTLTRQVSWPGSISH